MIEDAASLWDTYLSIGVSLLVILGAPAGVWWRMHVSIAAEKEARLLGDMAMRAEMDAFKTKVAQEYATNATVREVKDEVVNAIDKLSDRLDRVLERMTKA